MELEKLHRIQSVVKFVIAWLIAVYLFEFVRDGQHWAGGIVALIIAAGFNIYARKKAAQSVQTTPMFYVWLYAPVFVFFLLPVIIKAVGWGDSHKTVSWWQRTASLLPFVLKLGVPVGALMWIYFVLGRMAKRAAFPTEDLAPPTELRP